MRGMGIDMGVAKRHCHGREVDDMRGNEIRGHGGAARDAIGAAFDARVATSSVYHQFCVYNSIPLLSSSCFLRVFNAFEGQ
jgi:hypothetical protein